MMILIPEVTTKLLKAVSKDGEVLRVCIREQQIVFLPRQTRTTWQHVQEAGIGDMVQRFVTHRLSSSVSEHFRVGSYDISGKEIKVLK